MRQVRMWFWSTMTQLLAWAERRAHRSLLYARWKANGEPECWDDGSEEPGF